MGRKRDSYVELRQQKKAEEREAMADAVESTSLPARLPSNPDLFPLLVEISLAFDRDHWSACVGIIEEFGSAPDAQDLRQVGHLLDKLDKAMLKELDRL